MKFAPLFAAAAGSLAVAPLCPALTETILLDQGAPATALVPDSAADAADGSGLAWQHPDFDDGAWLTGTTGIGYETSGSNYAPLLGLNVAAMRNFRSSAYARIEFDAPADLGAFRSLTLRMKFDDGYAAWLNGTPVARSQAPAFDQLTWNEPSTGDHPDSAAEQFEDADITAHLPALRPGRNVLAIQILNGTIDSSDALALPQLVATDVAPPVFPDLRLEPFASGFPQLVDIQNAGDGSGRLFVLEQSGIIRVLGGGITQTFLNISGRVQSGGERGLLGLAFPPGFPDGGKDHFYVYYTTNAAGRGGDTVVSRFQLGGDGLGDPDSEEEILTADQPYQNHNGGQIRFGPDGFLYIGLGDGGDRDDPANRAQNPQSLLGKMLRLDPESGAATYSIPPGNPWAGAADPGDAVLDEIWALGLRNPWRWSFDKMTGDLWIADVGQDDWEEVSYAPAGSAGKNYEWRAIEGLHENPNLSTPDPSPSLGIITPPIWEYGHGLGTSITGGYVYRGSEFPRLFGAYLVGDYNSGRIWAIKPHGEGEWATRELADTTLRISCFGEAEDGTLYVADRGTNQIYRIADTQNADYLRITEAAVFGPSLRITFGAEIGKSYRLQCSDSMAAGDWQYITDPEQAADYQHAFFAPAPDGTPAARFYRVAEVE